MSTTAAPSTAVSEPAPTQTPTPTVYLPSRAHDAGSPLAFDSRPDGKIGGTWYIVGSSLPLWKSKKNVVIRYVANATAQGGEVKFDDEIRSDARSQKAPEGSGRKMRENVEKAWKDADGFKTKYFGIKGTNTLQDGAKNGASFQWKGKGLLRFFHSKWQVIGYGGYDLAASQEWDWIVTYFQETPATPAGIDVYARDPEKMPAATYEAILARLGRFEAEFTDTNDEDAKLAKAISKMANESFEIPHDP